MYGTWWSLVPPVVAILLALITKYIIYNHDRQHGSEYYYFRRTAWYDYRFDGEIRWICSIRKLGNEKN